MDLRSLKPLARCAIGLRKLRWWLPELHGQEEGMCGPTGLAVGPDAFCFRARADEVADLRHGILSMDGGESARVC
jgi:hypothetical protein